VLVERARCQLTTTALLRGESGELTETPARAALEDAKLALETEPTNPDVSRVLGDCYDALDRHREAERTRLGFLLYSGQLADTQEIELIDKIDQTLSDGRLDHARNLALTRLTPGELAARAALLGRWALASEQAIHVLRADPTDLDARVVLLVVTPGSAPGPAPLELLGSPARTRELSATSIVLFSQHLSRHVSEEASDAFLAPYRDEILHADDPLLRHLLESSN
jgi:hypothetical protein